MAFNPKCPACHGETVDLYSTDFPRNPLFYQCRTDEFCFTHPMPTSDDLRALYAEEYTRNESVLRRNMESAPDYWKKIKKYLPADKFSFLEIGGAFGYLSKMVAERTLAEVTMIEAGETAARFAQEKLGIETHRLMLEDYETEKQFEIVFGAHVIEHVLDVQAFLQLCKRLLKPGGKLLLLTPNGRAWKFGLLKRKWAWSVPNNHTLFLSEASVKILCKKVGFQNSVTKFTIPSPIHYPKPISGLVFLALKSLLGSTQVSTADSFMPLSAPVGARMSLKAKLKAFCKPFLWVEYLIFSFWDRVIGFGRRTDEILIITTKPRI